MEKEYVQKSNCPKVTMLRGLNVAIDEEGWFYELERQGNNYRALLHHEPIFHLDNTVGRWFDELDNYDLMVLTMWCIDNNLKLPYNFR